MVEFYKVFISKQKVKFVNKTMFECSRFDTMFIWQPVYRGITLYLINKRTIYIIMPLLNFKLSNLNYSPVNYTKQVLIITYSYIHHNYQTLLTGIDFNM